MERLHEEVFSLWQRTSPSIETAEALGASAATIHDGSHPDVSATFVPPTISNMHSTILLGDYWRCIRAKRIYSYSKGVEIWIAGFLVLHIFYPLRH